MGLPGLGGGSFMPGGGLFGGGGGGGGGMLGGLGLDLSLNKLPIIGNFVQNPQEQFKLAQMQEQGRQYGAYRPELAQARLNVMRQRSLGMQPMNNAMAQMYGPGAQMNTAGMFQNPMSQRMMGLGNVKPPGMGQGGGGGNPAEFLGNSMLPFGPLEGAMGYMAGGGGPKGAATYLTGPSAHFLGKYRR